MDDREKLIELLRSDMNVLKAAGTSATATLRLADNLIDGGVTFAKDTNVLTNADRIRAMSDEELARGMLQFVIDCCVLSGIENPQWNDGSEEEMIAWLKQPAEGE